MKRGIVFIATKERLDNIRTPENRRKKLFILVHAAGGGAGES